MSQKNNIQLLLGLVGILLLAGCHNYPEEPTGEATEYAMELMPLSTSFQEVQPWGITRADGSYPEGYIPYYTLNPAPSAAFRTIGVIMTPYRTTFSGRFDYDEDNSKWSSSVFVREDYPYYVYGFMPSEDIYADAVNVATSMLPGETTYEPGAVLSVTGYTTLTPADVCVIVGARWATEEEGVAGHPIDNDVRLGEFYYVGHEQGKNRIFVLLKHIYAGVQFKIQYDPDYPDYRRLRCIKVKKVELVAQDIAKSVDISVTLTANNEGKDPTLDPSNPTRSNIVYEDKGSSTTKSITIYEKAADSKGYDVPVTATQGFLGCYRPGKYTLVLRTTYDVYDRNQKKDDGGNLLFDDEGYPEYNLIREDCVAENTVDKSLIPELGAGELFTVNMLVRPTYLYVLSEPDLDNPTIKLTTTP